MSGAISQIAQLASIAVARANLAGREFTHFLQRSQLPIPATCLAYGVLKGSILVAGFLIVINFPGITTAPLFTSLEVGELAVASLQETIANLFAIGFGDSFLHLTLTCQGGGVRLVHMHEVMG